MVNHYDILGLSYDATQEDIQQAFRRLAKRYHPDTISFSASEEQIKQTQDKFRYILMAYQVLIDINERKTFDQKLFSQKNMVTIDNKTYPYLSRERVLYSTSLKTLLEKGLLNSKMKRKDRLFNLGSDIIVSLTSREVNTGVIAPIPIPARCVCDICYGEDTICPLCHGVGRLSKMETVYILIPPQSLHKQIIEVDLSDYRAKRLSYFAIRSIKICVEHLSKTGKPAAA